MRDRYRFGNVLAVSLRERMRVGRTRRTTVVTRLSAAVILVGVISIATTAAVGTITAREATDESIADRLDAARAANERVLRTDQRVLEQRARSVAASPTIAEAIDQLSAAFGALEVPEAELAEIDARLSDWYRTDFLPSLEAVMGRRSDLARSLPETSTGRVLQDRYTRPTASGEDPSTPGDGTEPDAWTKLHRDLHPALASLAERYGLSDLALVDADGMIVYTVAKRPEFATGLVAGPYSGTPLAEAVRQAERSGAVVTTDLVAHRATLEHPVRFAVAPVSEGDRLIGWLVFQVPVEHITDLLSQGRNWEAAGLGASGEAYTVGSDGTMRSDARQFLESPEQYLDTVVTAGTVMPAVRSRIESTGTTALAQVVRSDVVEAARSGITGVFDGRDHLGREVLASFGTVSLGEVEWVLIVQIDEDEARADIRRSERNLSMTMTIGVAVLVFAAGAWARRVAAPLRRVSDHLAGRDADLDRVDGPDLTEADLTEADLRFARGARELVDLEQAVFEMEAELDTRRHQVAAIEAEREDLLAQLLPRAVARRVRAGDREVFDQVPHATVGVLIIHGTEQLVEAMPPGEGRRCIARLIERLDSLASRHALGRIKLIGDAYYVACGHDRPYADHAPRVAAFALEAVEAVGTMEITTGSTTLEIDHVTASAAVHTGSLNVGLNGQSRLIYDIWGETVTTVYLMARSAAPGEVVMSEPTRERLPTSADVRPWSTDSFRGWRLDKVVGVAAPGDGDA